MTERSIRVTGLLIVTAVVGIGILFGARPDIHKRIIKVFNCDQISHSDDKEQILCWAKYLEQVYTQKGLSEAIRVAKETGRKNEKFQAVCHDILHKLGWAVYRDVRSGKKISFTPDANLCGYGLFHGFSEFLAQSGGNKNEARAFCDTVDASLSDELPDAVNQCFHGFGHGSVNVHDQTIWGNEAAMIAGAKQMCSSLARTGEELFRCGTGIFDAIAIAYSNHDYQLALDPDNPYGLCTRQEVFEYKKACFIGMNPAIMNLYRFDIRRAMPYIMRIGDPYFARMAMQNIAVTKSELMIHASPQEKKETMDFYTRQSIPFCLSLASELSAACIKSVAYALSFTQEDLGYADGLRYCRSESLTGSVRVDCFDSVLYAVSQLRGKTVLRRVCTNEITNEPTTSCQSML